MSDSDVPGSSSADSAERELRMLELISASWVSQALYVAAELGLPDQLLAGPRASRELAASSGCDPASLLRLLRALTTLELLRELDGGAFELTAFGALLASDAPGSLRAWTRWWGGHLWPVFGNLLHSVKTGQSARSLVYGTRGFQHLEQDASAADIFNRALVELTRLSARGVVEACDFSRFERIADVGGGHGELLASILKQHPGARGVLFDLSHAMAGAERHLSEAGVRERCELIVGDFFRELPFGCDAYVMKSVLHDWNDADCSRILRSCRRAMSGTSRLLLVEQMLPEHLTATSAHRSLARSDLLMLVALGARERSEPEFRGLLAGAGFEIERVSSAGSTFSVLEAVPSRGAA